MGKCVFPLFFWVQLSSDAFALSSSSSSSSSSISPICLPSVHPRLVEEEEEEDHAGESHTVAGWGATRWNYIRKRILGRREGTHLEFPNILVSLQFPKYSVLTSIPQIFERFTM